ncbi:MAG: Hsp20/alpha crystallin family protein [Deltaproteobacteria bacterium]|nr:Hsp20/alpha crystallin family protein [Deltaproteobacteria bacterium]
MATRKNTGQEIAPAKKTEIDVTRGEPTREGRYFTFAADIVENDEAVTVVADLPGVAPDAIDVDVRDNVLTILGRVDDVPAGWRPIHTEYEVGGYLRQFNVGPAIDQEKISATVRDGVLTLVLRKADRLRPRKIEIRAG